MILHLHPTHFRFDQQDGSFGYNSPMKVVLEHIKNQTVPHDMLEELFLSSVKFYDGCLIVQINDHRSSITNEQGGSSQSNRKSDAQQFSVHKWNEHLTPSPFAPYPMRSKMHDCSTSRRASSSVTPGPIKLELSTQAERDKGNMPAPALPHKKPTQGPVVYTRVLHSTSLSLNVEMTLFATMNERSSKRQAPNGSKDVSTTQPPTPHSTVPPTPTGSKTLPIKKQKTLLEEKDFSNFESHILQMTEMPLFLEPTYNFEESQQLLHRLEHPLHCAEPPAPRTRKRTTAELAADEAQVARDERFMLVMDEKIRPAAATASGSSASAESQKPGSFEPNFARFKVLENIRMEHGERKREEAQAKLERDRLELARKHERMEQMKMEQQARQLMQQRQLAMSAGAMQQRGIPMPAPPQQNTIPNPQQQALLQAAQAQQAQHGSPVVRQQTPMHPSPVVSNGMMPNLAMSGIPMSITGSNQGIAGSPPHPPSSAQPQPNPMVHSTMARQMSQQTNQSRLGTPRCPRRRLRWAK